MPGWITQSRSSAWTASTWFMSRRLMQTPPDGALTWPSSDVPVPNAITGTRCGAQIRTTSWMSAVSCAITTASGGCDASHVVVWACWSRTACEVIMRLPKRAASASSAAASARGSARDVSGRLSTSSSSRRADRDKPCISGQGSLRSPSDSGLNAANEIGTSLKLVMPGREPPATSSSSGRARCPGYPRLINEDVDGRDKPGHDSLRECV